MNVTTVFLNGKLQEDMYITQPKDFTFTNPHKVCKLQKPIYGLRQVSKELEHYFL